MMKNEKHHFVFDPLLGALEDLINKNSIEILTRNAQITDKLTESIYRKLPYCKSRSAQFELIHDAINQGEAQFKKKCGGFAKETVMSIARRAPKNFIGDADLLLATLIVKYGASVSEKSWSFTNKNIHGLGLAFTYEDVGAICELMAIAKTMNHFRGMARWLGKGGKLIIAKDERLLVDLPEEVMTSVEAYERRRVKGRSFDAAGFFVPEPQSATWSQYRIPILSEFDNACMIEAPKGSQRWLSFERFGTMLDGGGLANILRAYDTPLMEIYGVGSEVISHTLTALAVLIFDNTPRLAEDSDSLAFAEGATSEITEHKIGFAFGLARKGFLRFPKANLIKNLGRVRTPFAPDQAAGEQLGEGFISAFLMSPDATPTIGPIEASNVPFLHESTENHIYIDLLLIGDFLNCVIENAKQWYASQHGDRFSLDLKRWLNQAAPEAVIDARRPIELEDGGQSDIDILVRDRHGLIVVECKAYAKSQAFLTGKPNAVTQRRGRLRSAMAQAQRISNALECEVAAGKTEFPIGLKVRPLVCSPSAEFLLPFDEFGLERTDIPKVITPEELLELLKDEPV